MSEKKWTDPQPQGDLPVPTEDAEGLDAELSEEFAALSGHGDEHLEIRATHPEDPRLEEEPPPEPEDLAALALADETETELHPEDDIPAEEDIQLIRKRP